MPCVLLCRAPVFVLAVSQSVLREDEYLCPATLVLSFIHFVCTLWLAGFWSKKQSMHAWRSIPMSKASIAIADWCHESIDIMVVRYILGKFHILFIHFTPLLFRLAFAFLLYSSFRVALLVGMQTWNYFWKIHHPASTQSTLHSPHRQNPYARMRENRRKITINAGVNLSLVVSVVFKCVGTSSSHTIIVSPTLRCPAILFVAVWFAMLLCLVTPGLHSYLFCVFSFCFNRILNLSPVKLSIELNKHVSYICIEYKNEIKEMRGYTRNKLLFLKRVVKNRWLSSVQTQNKKKSALKSHMSFRPVCVALLEWAQSV